MNTNREMVFEIFYQINFSIFHTHTVYCFFVVILNISLLCSIVVQTCCRTSTSAFAGPATLATASARTVALPPQEEEALALPLPVPRTLAFAALVPITATLSSVHARLDTRVRKMFRRKNVPFRG